MSNRNSALLILAIIVVVAFILVKRHKGHGVVPKASEKVAEGVALLPATPAKANDTKQQDEAADLHRRQMEFITGTQTGPGFYHLEDTKDALVARLKFIALPVCHMADTDIIFHDYRKTDSNRIIITIESLYEKKVFGLEEISLEKMKTGFEKVFKLPKNTTSDVIGIFICSDSSRKGQCSDKPPIDFNKAMNEKNPEKTKYIDKVYIFNPAVVTNKLLHYMTQVPIPKSELAHIVAEKSMQQLDAAKLEKALAAAAKLSAALRSYTPESGLKGLKIMMPQMNQMGCQTKGAVP